MKYYLLLFALIMTSFSQGQTTFKTCEAAESAAEEDAKNGNYVQRNYGKPMPMTTAIDNKYKPFFNTMLFSKYGITVLELGCVISEHDFCYTNKMNSLIDAKFGTSFFENTEKEIKELYNKTNKEKLATHLDLEKIYPMFMIEKKAELNNNVGDLNKTLKNIFSSKEKENYEQQIILVISNKGEIIDYKLSSTITSKNSKVENIKKLKALGNWDSGIIFGKKVNSELAITYAYL